MKIQTIEYKRLVSFRDEWDRPSNETFGATALVDEGEHVVDARGKLVTAVELWHQEHGRLRDDLRSTRATVEALGSRKAYLAHEIVRLTLEVEEVRAIHAAEVGEEDFEIPF